MKAVMLYRPNSEHERRALDYARDVKMQTGKTLPLLDVDSPEGVEQAKMYDIMEYPALLVTDDEGHMQNIWIGDQLPTISEASYYVPGDQPVSQK